MSRFTAWRLFGSHLLALGLAGAILCGIAYVERLLCAPDNAALVLTTPVSAASLGQRQLPASWRVPLGQATANEFTFRFDLPTTPARDLMVYIPRYEQRLSLRLNGQTIGQGSFRDNWYGLLHFASGTSTLPRRLLRAGTNELQVTVSAGPVIFGSLAPIQIGDPEALGPLANLRRFIGADLLKLIFGCQLLLAGLTVLGRDDPRFRWFGVVMIASCLHQVGVFADAFPSLLAGSVALFPMALLSALCVLGFVSLYCGRGVPRGLPWLIVATVVPTALLQWMGLVSPYHLTLFLIGPMTIIAIVTALGLMVRSLSARWRNDQMLLLVGLLLIFGGLLHDMSLRADLIDGVLFWTPYLRSFVLIAVGAFLLYQYRAQTQRITRFSVELESRLRTKEAELDAVLDRERENAAWIAAEQERRRITLELHDGVASQLVTITALAESGKDGRASIQQAARGALQDLRLVIDTLSNRHGDLGSILASFRERCLGPLEKLDLDVLWSIDDLPPVTGFQPRGALNIVRILQEALANALRHGHPRWVELGASAHGNEVILRLKNGGGTGFESGKRGFGIVNMERRARELGGSLVIRHAGDMTSVELRFPLPSTRV